mgnify:CR=1 FL=1
MEIDSIFTAFKQQKNFKVKRFDSDVYFQINKDEQGIYINVVSKKGEIIKGEYPQLNGPDGILLESIYQIKENNLTKIDWTNPESNIYLHKYPFLISLLKSSKKIVDRTLRPLKFHDKIVSVVLEITKIKKDKNDKIFNAILGITTKKERITEFEFINESYILGEHLIFETSNVGQNFANAGLFNTQIKEIDFSLYFSMFYSFLDNVEVIFKEYKIESKEEKIDAKSSLVFEKIGEDNSLYVSLKQTLPNLKPGILNEFALSKIAIINPLEKKIYIHQINTTALEKEIVIIEKTLKKVQNEGAFKNKILLSDDGSFILPAECANAFIFTELPNLIQYFEVFGHEQLKAFNFVKIQPKMNLSLSSGIDYFEGEVEFDFEGEKMDLNTLLKMYRKNNFIKLSNGKACFLDQNYIKRLERIFKQKKKGVVLSFFDLPIVEELIEDNVKLKAIENAKHIFEGFNKLNQKKYSKPKIKAKLRPYQSYGYKWLKYLHEHKLGGCLADDMGLGKTLQAISILSSVYPKEKKSSLIIMPRSLLFNWEREVEKFAPQLSTYTYYNNNRDLEQAQKSNLIFTTYAMVRNNVEKFQEENFYYVILDESQNIKNLNSQSTKSVLLLKCAHRLALSGTPMENNLSELYSLFRFLNPSMFGSFKNFSDQFLKPIQKNNDDIAAQNLKKKIYPFLLRRLKKDVLPELPAKTEQILYVEMSESHAKLYHEKRAFFKATIDSAIAANGLNNSKLYVFQALSELRQVASSPEKFSDGLVNSAKKEMLKKYIEDLIASDRKALIFANYLFSIESISKLLGSMEIQFVAMTGATKNRQELVNKFQTDSECKIFLMTLKTGGTGLNLTSADTIFIYEPWWNLAAENQAIDRAHRIGQKQKVLAYKLITKDTIEEKILELQLKKGELFDKVISTDSSALKSMDEQDIDFILGI